MRWLGDSLLETLVFCSIYITQMDVIFDYYCTLQLNGAILLSETLQIFPPLSSHHCDEPKEV